MLDTYGWHEHVKNYSFKEAAEYVLVGAALLDMADSRLELDNANACL